MSWQLSTSQNDTNLISTSCQLSTPQDSSSSRLLLQHLRMILTGFLCHVNRQHLGTTLTRFQHPISCQHLRMILTGFPCHVNHQHLRTTLTRFQHPISCQHLRMILTGFPCHGNYQHLRTTLTRFQHPVSRQHLRTTLTGFQHPVSRQHLRMILTLKDVHGKKAPRVQPPLLHPSETSSAATRKAYARAVFPPVRRQSLQL